MNEPTTTGAPLRQSDLMLAIAAAAVVGMGAVWLVLAAPWSSPAPAPSASSPAAVSVERVALTMPLGSPGSADPARADGSSLDNPLRLAQLAYEAGMLVEPEEYSAWTLYTRALEQNASSEAARQGLGRVADELLARGAVAVEQGRYDDARATIARILEALPEHAGAMALAERVRAAEPPPARLTPPATVKPEPDERARRAPEPVISPARVENAPARTTPPVDRIKGLAEAFQRSLAANELLTPPDRSARHYVEEMLAIDANDDRARDLRDLLVTELLSRSNQAIEALDLEAARTWVDEAEGIAGDPSAIAAQRERLTAGVIAMESARPMSASELTILDYVPPEYPRPALTREIEGWVDVEFVVDVDGTTHDIEVADASHDRYFQEQAIEAVTAWRFEPRVFMDRPIAQRVYTRVRFELDD